MAKQNMGDMEKKKILFTVQKLDTSVPVECGGERVAPPRSSASDHYVLPVGNQAGVLDKATGMEIDPFARRSSIQRSPPRRYSVPDITGEDDAIELSPPKTQITKRKRIEADDTTGHRTPQNKSKTEQSSKILKIIECVGQEAKALVRTARESTNTKKEIRDISAKLLRLTEQLMGHEIQETLRNAMKKLNEETTEDEANLYLKRKMCNASTQTVEDGGDPEQMTTQELDTYISKGIDQETLKQIIETSWEIDCYKKTTTTSDHSIQKLLDGRDIAIFMDAKTATENELVQGVVTRIPQIRNLIEANRPDYGKVACVTNNSRIWMEGEEGTETENFTFLLGLPKVQDENNGNYQLYQTTKRLAAAMKHKGIKQITIVPPKEWHQAQTRKAIECAIRESDVEACICMKQKIQNKKRNLGEAVLIDKGNYTYAELLNKVKKEVQDQGLTDKIGGARKTKTGNLLLTLEGSGGTAACIAKALKGIGGVKVREDQDRTILHIKNIDAVTNIQEVEAAVSDALAVVGKKGNISVSSLRPGYGETQTATVIMPREAAESVLKAGKIRIGLVNCRVQERVKVETCYRCWEVGHVAKYCKGLDRSNLCIQCGEGDHQRRDCSKEPHCALCKTTGHKPLTMKCPLYRKEVTKLSRAKHQIS